MTVCECVCVWGGDGAPVADGCFLYVCVLL